MIKLIKKLINYFKRKMENRRAQNVKKFTADFETCVWCENETWVWAWAVCEIGNEENIQIDNNLDSFMEFCKNEKNATFYFHNLKFDGEFIIHWLLTHGFKHIEKKEDIAENTFSTVISDMGQFYCITVYYSKGNKQIHKTTFIDSLKIIPFSVDQIAKTFGLPISKLKIDYKKPRYRGWRLTSLEKDYIKNDVLIVAKALKTLFDDNLTKMTMGSNALNDFREIIGKKKFEHYFPQLPYEVDKEIRKSYKGGFTYMNPVYKNKINGKTTVLDVNSLYPSVMYTRRLPYGEPVYFEGEYKEDKVYDLYIQCIRCKFTLKEGKIPTIQIKNSHFMDTEYLESSNGEEVILNLTNIDLKLFLEQYNTKNLEYIDGWKFKSMESKFFKEYIDKWITVKNEGTISGNKGQRQRAKLMLNSLYGKFATSLDLQSKIPYLKEDGSVGYTLSDKTTKEGIYIPMGCFITSYARELTQRTSQAIKTYSLQKYGKDLYCYSDTDSIHCLLDIEELKQFCDIDDVRLGAWKHEGTFPHSKFVRQKTYVEVDDENECHITCAGMPKNCVYKKEDEAKNKLFYKDLEGEEKEFKLQDFKEGFSCGGKLAFKHIPGGVILVETDFTVKEDKKKGEIKK